MLYANIREFKFLSEFDELEISAVNAIPLDTVHGVVQIVHGLCEHKEMYFPFMDYLAEQGFITVISDNRGHGQSICAPDDLGYMFQNGGEGLVSDLAQLNKFIKQAWNNIPVFIIAHGLGSVAALLFPAARATAVSQALSGALTLLLQKSPARVSAATRYAELSRAVWELHSMMKSPTRGDVPTPMLWKDSTEIRFAALSRP